MKYISINSLLCFLFLLLGKVSIGQNLIAKWTFDASTSVPDSGSGHFAAKGSAAFTAFVQGNPSTGKAFNTNSYPAQGTGNLTSGVRIKISTTGFKDLQFRFDQQNSNTGNKKNVIMISTDSINYTKVDSLIFSSGGSFNSKTVNLSSFTSLNNKPFVYIFLASGFTGTAYVASNATSNYGTTGTWRFDNIRITGTGITSAKPNLNLTINKSSLSESLSDTAKLIFTLTDTLSKKISSKILFNGTGITSGDFSWIGKDSFVIARGKYSDTLLLAITNDTLVESLETGAFTFQNQDSSYNLGSTMGLQLINDDISTIKISTVQGTSRSSSYVNSVVSLDGIVTSDLQGTNEQGGFYMQDFSPDSDPLTSDGIFVSTTAFAVSKGNRVKVTGKVIENFGQTVLSTVSALTIVSNNHSVTPVNINFPLDSVSFLEHFEGMMIKVNQTLTVTENFTLGRYGELTVSANGRLLNPTNQIDPNDNPKSGTSSSGTSNLAAVSALQSLNSRSKLLVCDKLSIQNPNPIPFIDPINNTLRSGTTIDTLTGVLGYDFSVYRVYPDNGNPKFNYAARPSIPSISGANVKIAGTNVLNFFNGDGLGGGYPTARGAKNANELARQKAKIVALITAMDMDVLGLMEMENDGDSTYSAIRELVTSINSALGSNVYGYIRDSKGANGKPGSDQIKVALIYKTAVVTPVGASLSHNDASFTLLGRPPLAQTFSLNSNLEKFTVIVNHFKSKGCATSPADVLDNDQNDGQGCFNSTRKKQATALLNFISTIIQNTGDSDIVTVGDFNAYEQEDPLDLLRAGGLKSIVEDSYSYVFNGEAGSLDHGFATASMYRTLSGGAKWHVNCDEPLIIDYTTSFKTQDLYSSIPYRSSDHDPLMSGFNLLRFCGAGIPNGANVKTGNVTLKTQTEVDAFYNSTAGANYGNKWTKINGNLTLDGSNYSDPITSLCNLNYLTEITGSVIITNFNRNANPTNLDDLAGLKTVGCNLSIISNPKLIRVSLNSLNTVGCSFNIQNNAVATDIRMPQFTGMSGDKLIVKKNPKAEVISFSHQAANFSFTGKGSNIEISENGGSTSIPLRINFRKVKSLKGSLIFNNNNNTGVSNFDSIFTGLTHIYSSTYGNLVITNNTYLLKCCIAASTVVAGSRTISGNTGNCATLTAVTNDCGTLFKRSIASSSFSTGEISLDLYPNPTQGLFSLKVYGIESGLLKVQMTDLLGREILNNSYNVTDSNSVSIDMDSANAGQYILKAEINGQQIIKRFTIVK